MKIGDTLRAAREVEGLTFEQIERQTRIRAKYFAALESERFDQLPGEAYGRTFLREYAQLLGIEPTPLVQEFDRRFAQPELAPMILTPIGRRRRRPRLLFLVLVAAAIAGVLAWRAGGDDAPDLGAPQAADVQSGPAPQNAPPATAGEREKPQRVVVRAHGRSWLVVYADSPSGPLLYKGFLNDGQSVAFTRSRLWVRFGAPWNLAVRVNGKPVRLANSSNPINVLFAKREALTA